MGCAPEVEALGGRTQEWTPSPTLTLSSCVSRSGLPRALSNDFPIALTNTVNTSLKNCLTVAMLVTGSRKLLRAG